MGVVLDASQELAGGLAVLICWGAGALVGLVVYGIPAFVAVKRDHRNMVPIFVVNLLFGWTFLGWAIALIWSLTDNVEPPRRR